MSDPQTQSLEELNNKFRAVQQPTDMVNFPARILASKGALNIVAINSLLNAECYDFTLGGKKRPPAARGQFSAIQEKLKEWQRENGLEDNGELTKETVEKLNEDLKQYNQVKAARRAHTLPLPMDSVILAYRRTKVAEAQEMAKSAKEPDNISASGAGNATSEPQSTQSIQRDDTSSINNEGTIANHPEKENPAATRERRVEPEKPVVPQKNNAEPLLKELPETVTAATGIPKIAPIVNAAAPQTAVAEVKDFNLANPSDKNVRDLIAAMDYIDPSLAERFKQPGRAERDILKDYVIAHKKEVLREKNPNGDVTQALLDDVDGTVRDGLDLEEKRRKNAVEAKIINAKYDLLHDQLSVLRYDFEKNNPGKNYDPLKDYDYNTLMLKPEALVRYGQVKDLVKASMQLDKAVLEEAKKTYVSLTSKAGLNTSELTWDEERKLLGTLDKLSPEEKAQLSKTLDILEKPYTDEEKARQNQAIQEGKEAIKKQRAAGAGQTH